MIILSQAQANRRGIVAMVLAMALFICNDTLVKYAGQSLPAGQIVLLRGLAVTLWISLMAAALGALRQWRLALAPAVLARAALEATATFVYLAALFHLPIANATAINLSIPLLLTVLAVLLLREKVGWRRWSAVAAGFLGVLLVVQPTPSGFNWYALVALAATVLHAFRDLTTRRIPPHIPSVLVTLTSATMVTMGGGALSLAEDWTPLSWSIAGLLLAASLLLTGAYYLLIEGMRQGELSVIAPFRYVGILWALLLGYAVWGDVPNAVAGAGIVILVASGVYIFHRERVRARPPDPAAPERDASS